MCGTYGPVGTASIQYPRTHPQSPCGWRHPQPLRDSGRPHPAMRERPLAVRAGAPRPRIAAAGSAPASSPEGDEMDTSRPEGMRRRRRVCKVIAVLFPDPLLRKEVIQPQVPLRLPCYDFTPVADLTVVGCLLAVSSPASGKTNSHGVTGGVYKARERIHRGVLIRDY